MLDLLLMILFLMLNIPFNSNKLQYMRLYLFWSKFDHVNESCIRLKNEVSITNKSGTSNL